MRSQRRRTFRCGTLIATASVSFALLSHLGVSAQAASRAGWGPEASYLGRYRVHPLPLASGGGSALSGEAAQAGIFGQVVAGVQKVLDHQSHPAGGELTLFMRTIHKGQPPVPSGILNLHSASANRVLYLTELTSDGASREAKVNGGAFVGPVIGSFTATSTAKGELSGTVNAEGLGTLVATFTRFSDEAQP